MLIAVIECVLDSLLPIFYMNKNVVAYTRKKRYTVLGMQIFRNVLT